MGSVLVWIPKSRVWDKDLGASSSFGRWSQEEVVRGKRGRETGKEKKPSGWFGVHYQGVSSKPQGSNFIGPLPSVQRSPRIALKDSKWRHFSTGSISTGLELPASGITSPLSQARPCVWDESVLKSSEKAGRQKSRVMHSGSIALEQSAFVALSSSGSWSQKQMTQSEAFR
jgi:hypothetical protein